MSGLGKYIYTDQLCQFQYTEGHPFNPLRLELTTDLLKELGLLHKDDIVVPEPASIETLSLVHDPQYIELVQSASKGKMSRGLNLSCGLGTDDNPIFCNMHNAASLSVGATVRAAQEILENNVDHVLNISGGLHHAQQNQASGFCIYNDIAVAIAWMKEKYGLKVMYIDTDAHHGDGVQWFFYSDPNVLTVSIHEAGRYLFPGTGNIDELGVGLGKGYCLNLPLEPYTNDTSYLECFEEVLSIAMKSFKPDIIVSQHGCDIHYLDPLTHISVTSKTLSQIPRTIHNLAHEYTGGRWLALGGGGYDIWNVVPRAWSFVWSEVVHRPLPIRLSKNWIEKWQKKSPARLWRFFQDDLVEHKDNPRIEAIKEKNTVTLDRLLRSYRLIND